MGPGCTGGAPGSAEPLRAHSALSFLGQSGRPGASIVHWRSREGHMAHIARIKRPGLLTRTFFKIGERMFGQVPTPERLMAHRLPLMLGIGGLYGAIEWFGKIDAPLRALLNVQVAALYGVPY